MVHALTLRLVFRCKIRRFVQILAGKRNRPLPCWSFEAVCQTDALRKPRGTPWLLMGSRSLADSLEAPKGQRSISLPCKDLNKTSNFTAEDESQSQSMHHGSFEIKLIYQPLSTRSVVGNNELFVCHTYIYTFSHLHHLKKMLLEFHYLFIGFP
jgi:hypothetical protein